MRGVPVPQARRTNAQRPGGGEENASLRAWYGDGMKKFLILTSVAALLAASCRAPDVEETPESAPEPPAAVPTAAIPRAEILGAGTVSTEAPEFAVSVDAGGEELYFNRASADRSELVILSSRHQDGAWSDAEAVPFSTGVYRDVDPFVTADGSRLYFSSNRPAAGETEPGDFDIWLVERTAGGGWGEPVGLGAPVNSAATEIYSTLTKNGNLYFGSDRDGEYGLYRSEFVDGAFVEPERLVFGDGDAWSDVSNPAIAPDESFLIFSAERDDGLGGSDLYLSFQQEAGWSPPLRLDAPVSSAFADFAPTISWDGRFLYWTSERPGIVGTVAATERPPGDLYRIDGSALGRE